MQERKSAYSQSDMLVNTEYRSAKEVAQLILSQFSQAVARKVS